MGLSEWNEEVRSEAYPPRTVTEALEFSGSDYVEGLYAGAEALSRGGGTLRGLPPELMTWPGGQLTGIGRNGRYASNVARYERVFRDAFPKEANSWGGRRPPNDENSSSSSGLIFTTVVPLERLSDINKLRDVLEDVTNKVTRRCGGTERNGAIAVPRNLALIRRNSGKRSSRALRGLSTTERLTFERHFAEDTAELEKMCGMRLGWKSSPRDSKVLAEVERISGKAL